MINNMIWIYSCVIILLFNMHKKKLKNAFSTRKERKRDRRRRDVSSV